MKKSFITSGPDQLSNLIWQYVANLHPFSFKHVFSIKVENNVDSDPMAFYPNNPDLHSFQKEITLYSLGQGQIFLCSPNPEGGFGADPVGVGVGVRFFVSVHYLLNQLMDFAQTCIETLLGGGEELIRIWWPWPYFQGHKGTLKCPEYGFGALSCELADRFWPNLHR